MLTNSMLWSRQSKWNMLPKLSSWMCIYLAIISQRTAVWLAYNSRESEHLHLPLYHDFPHLMCHHFHLKLALIYPSLLFTNKMQQFFYWIYIELYLLNIIFIKTICTKHSLNFSQTTLYLWLFVTNNNFGKPHREKNHCLTFSQFVMRNTYMITTLIWR